MRISNKLRRCLLTALGGMMIIKGAAVGAEDFSARDVYREAAPSVVMVYARVSSNKSNTGTGSVISEDGLILTNAHVVTSASGSQSPEIAVFFKPERVTGDLKRDLREGHRARVVARDPKLDLALLRLTGGLPAGMTPLAFGDSEEVEIGEPVAAIGHPGGGGLWTLTTGTISSARQRGDLDVFQTDAAINPGNSGGPLLDAQARVIGVNTFVVRVSDSGLPLEGLNYSLRGNLVRSWLSRHGARVAVRPRTTVVASREPAQAADPAPARTRPAAPAQTDPPPRIAPPAEQDQPRRFRGRDGEEMFGVPDREFSHDEVQDELYGRARSNARKAFEELDSLN